jgi:hypothetical protein
VNRIRETAGQQLYVYSYWFDHTAAGLAIMKQEFPGTKVVSRAHGYDIYEEYYYPYYWPYRRETLDAVDLLFFASEAGQNYFCEHYPEYVSKFETAHLGTKDPGFVGKSSSDGICRIVSCAHIVPVKRLDLLLDGIATAARFRPEQKFEWFHFGDGAGKNHSIEKWLGIFHRMPRVGSWEMCRTMKSCNIIKIILLMYLSMSAAPKEARR